MVSHACLGVRRRYRDDVRLDSRYAKRGGKWRHVLVSTSIVATATTPASTRVAQRLGEMVSRARLGERRRYRDDVHLDSHYAKTGGEMVSRARLGIRRRYRDDVRLDSRYAMTGGKWCHVLVSASVVATATTSTSTRVALRYEGNGVTCLSRRPSSLPR